MPNEQNSPRIHPAANRIPIITLPTILLVSFLWSCGNYIPRTGKVTVKFHEDRDRNGTYCKYEIIKDLPSGAALKVGDIICIFCPAEKAGCDDYDQIEDSDGLVYKVKALTKGLACTTCPKGLDTPPGNTREIN